MGFLRNPDLTATSIRGRNGTIRQPSYAQRKAPGFRVVPRLVKCCARRAKNTRVKCRPIKCQSDPPPPTNPTPTHTIERQFNWSIDTQSTFHQFAELNRAIAVQQCQVGEEKRQHVVPGIGAVREGRSSKAVRGAAVGWREHDETICEALNLRERRSAYVYESEGESAEQLAGLHRRTRTAADHVPSLHLPDGAIIIITIFSAAEPARACRSSQRTRIHRTTTAPPTARRIIIASRRSPAVDAASTASFLQLLIAGVFYDAHNCGRAQG